MIDDFEDSPAYWDFMTQPLLGNRLCALPKERIKPPKSNKVYVVPDNDRYCDKPQHRESSLVHQPNHKEHWRKVRNVFRRGVK